MAKYQQTRVILHLLWSLLALVVIFIIGTTGFHFLGGPGYSWEDCFYMTFITITTIGYGEIVDVTHYEYGRMFTVFIGILGIGVLGYVLSTVTAFILESDLNLSWRIKKMQKKIDRLKDHYIVCGVGLVGSNVAHDLEMTGRASVIIENDMKNILRYVDLHPEQLYLQGDATDNDVLLLAGVMRAKGVFAVAHDDSANLVISLSAKQLNQNLRVVARCHDMKNAEKTRRAGADEIVSPDFSGGQRIVSAMLRPNVMNFLDEMFKSSTNLRMEEIVIPDSMEDTTLSVLYHGNQDCLVLAVMSEKEWMFNPPASYLLRAKDVLMVMTTPKARERLEDILLSS
ncbi:MAG: NAD-binding protein [Gallionella sp.]|nr:NAD-binding protein [Gallionella sp.]